MLCASAPGAKGLVRVPSRSRFPGAVGIDRTGRDDNRLTSRGEEWPRGSGSKAVTARERGSTLRQMCVRTVCPQIPWAQRPDWTYADELE